MTLKTILIIAGIIILVALFIWWMVYEFKHAQDVDPRDENFLD